MAQLWTFSIVSELLVHYPPKPSSGVILTFLFSWETMTLLSHLSRVLSSIAENRSKWKQIYAISQVNPMFTMHSFQSHGQVTLNILRTRSTKEKKLKWFSSTLKEYFNADLFSFQRRACEYQCLTTKLNAATLNFFFVLLRQFSLFNWDVSIWKNCRHFRQENRSCGVFCENLLAHWSGRNRAQVGLYIAWF